MFGHLDIQKQITDIRTSTDTHKNTNIPIVYPSIDWQICLDWCPNWVIRLAERETKKERERGTERERGKKMDRSLLTCPMLCKHLTNFMLLQTCSNYCSLSLICASSWHPAELASKGMGQCKWARDLLKRQLTLITQITSELFIDLAWNGGYAHQLTLLWEREWGHIN